MGEGADAGRENRLVQQRIPHHYHGSGIFRFHILSSRIVRACVVIPCFFGFGVFLSILGNSNRAKAGSLGAFRNGKDNSDNNGQPETAHRSRHKL